MSDIRGLLQEVYRQMGKGNFEEQYRALCYHKTMKILRVTPLNIYMHTEQFQINRLNFHSFRVMSLIDELKIYLMVHFEKCFLKALKRFFFI